MDSIDPRTGVATATGIRATDSVGVDAAVRAADEARRSPIVQSRASRAALLEALAVALESDRERLAGIADGETGLGITRLAGEVDRCAFQFRMFASVVRDGGYLEAMIDPAAETPLGPVPDIRRMLVPLSVVAVFGASNFPFAFSVAGGDVASALAAGSGVVVKAHGSHLLTSRATFDVLGDALSSFGASRGLLGIVYGTQAGVDLLSHPRVAAAGFTGSLETGRILAGVIATRPDPIPFYGELSSVNPLVITESAARRRSGEIADGLAASFLQGAGQFCTKPGVAFIPSGEDGDELVRRLAAIADRARAQVLLNFRIRDAFRTLSRERAGGRPLLGDAPSDDGSAFSVDPVLVEIPARELTPAMTGEVFGPFLVLVRYSTIGEVIDAVRTVPDSLTATIHHTDDDLEVARELSRALQPRSGRIVFNGYPTGVRVSWAQHHGGPWPATNSLHTSVGATSIRRFLRPIAYQNSPQDLLPEELRDDYRGIPRRVGGRLALPDA